MTDINGNELKPRVLIDWDANGFMSTGVPQGTPINVFPSALYSVDANVWSYALSAPTKRFNSEYAGDGVRGWGRSAFYLGGAYKRGLAFFKGYDRHQQHPDDVTNLTPESLYADYTGYGTLTNTVTPPTRRELYNDNDRLGLAMFSYTENDRRIGGAIRGTLGVTATHADGTPGKYGGSGYIDAGPNRWSRALSSDAGVASTAVTWSGFPTVTPGEYYTLIFYVSLLDRANGGGSAVTFRPRLYGNGGAAGTPSFGRRDLGGNDTPIQQGVWTQIKINFIPAAGTDRIYLDLAVNGGDSWEINIAGLMLLTATGYYPNPQRYWSAARRFTQEQFPFTIPGDNQPYRLSYWVRRTTATANVTSLIPVTHVIDPATGLETSATTEATVDNATNDWQRVDISIAASTAPRLLYQTFTPTVNVLAQFEFEGFMLVPGTTLYPYHAGEAVGYEDVTQYVVAATTQSGRDAFLDTLPSEGTATIQLRNDGRLFSPKNAASVYAKWMKPNRKVLIQLKDPRTNAWTTIWSGWTHTFEVTPGTTGDNLATITARQGLFRLEEGNPPTNIVTYTNLQTIIPALVQSSGWVTAKEALQSQVGLNAITDQSAFTTDVDAFFNRIENGLEIIEVAGKDWADSDDPRKAIDDLLAAENAALWIDRDGGLSLINREYYVRTEPDDTLVLGSDSVSAEYTYGQDIVNRVEVKLNPNQLTTGAVAWEHRRPVRIGSKKVWVVEMNPEYTEGKRRSVIQYTLDGLVKDVYIKDPGLSGDTTGLNAEQEDKDKVIVELLQNTSTRPRLRITNNSPYTLWVSLKVKGDYLKTGDSETYVYDDTDSIEENGAVLIHNFTSSLINDEQAARRYAEYILQRQARPQSEYGSVSIVVSSTDLLETVLDTTLGTVLALGEPQTGETALNHVVLGESFDFITNRHLGVTYKLARTYSEAFLKADLSVVPEPGVNLLPIEYQGHALPTFGGEFKEINWREDDLTRLMVWETGPGHNNTLVLSPDAAQVTTRNFFEDADTYPKNSIAPLPVHRDVYTDRAFTSPVAAGWLVMPRGYRYILQAHLNGLSGITQELLWKLGRDRDTDVSASTPNYVPKLPVCAGEKYRAYCSYFWPNVTTGVQTLNSVYDFSTARLLLPYVKRAGASTGVQVAAQWASTAAAVAVNAAETHNFMVGSGVDFRAVPSGTGYNPDGLSGNGQPVGAVGFRLLNTPSPAAWGNPVAFSMLRYSGYARYSGIRLSLTDAHYFTVFLRMQPGYADEDYTLTVIGDDGATIGTQTATITAAGITKLQVALPTGTVSAWGNIKKAVNNYLNSRLLIYGWGISYTAVNSYTDLLERYTMERLHA